MEIRVENKVSSLFDSDPVETDARGRENVSDGEWRRYIGRETYTQVPSASHSMSRVKSLRWTGSRKE